MRRKLFAVLPFVLVLAGLAAVLVRCSLRDAESVTKMKAATHLRGIMQGLVIYAQDHGGVMPDAARWQTSLVDSGLLPAEVLKHPRTRRGVEPWIAVYQYAPTEDRQRWTNNFQATHPVVVENPEVWDGEGAFVAYNDNHVQWEDGASVRKMLEELHGTK